MAGFGEFEDWSKDLLINADGVTVILKVDMEMANLVHIL